MATSDAVLDVALPPPDDKPTTDSQTDALDPRHHQWILQLAPLASQHHMSEYSRIKYGHRGCPTAYTPLSLQLPSVVRGLRERQKIYADQVLWWPRAASPANRVSSPLIPAAKQRAALAAGETIPHPELQHELFSALSEPITTQSNGQDTGHSASHVKTSESHPINISQIIPPESLIAISSHLSPCKRPCPVLFEIHLPYSLDHIAGHPQPFPSRLGSPTVPAHSSPIPAASPRSSVTSALNAALNTKISLPPLPVATSRILFSLKRNLRNHTVSNGTSESDVDEPISKLALRQSSFSSTDLMSQTPHSCLPSNLALPNTYALHPFLPHIRPSTASSPPNKISRLRTSKASSTPSRQGIASQRNFKLGNLLLSSCPGKKVRLSGPVRGRSAVCRDLDVDLRRMKMLGVQCVVCCLDDEEIEFLIGVSWTEYCQVAHREGFDVLRIPLPEGLAPLSPKSLDTDLDRIIESYSLQGISVLVHCRGGVGRAGLFACCWMLKLGLCGWIETDTPSTTTTTTAEIEIKQQDDNPSDARWDSHTVVRRDTLQLVERVIEVVRRRRSAKAIETLEQVQFLVEYVDYLRTRGHASVNSRTL